MKNNKQQQNTKPVLNNIKKGFDFKLKVKPIYHKTCILLKIAAFSVLITAINTATVPVGSV